MYSTTHTIHVAHTLNDQVVGQSLRWVLTNQAQRSLTFVIAPYYYVYVLSKQYNACANQMGLMCLFTQDHIIWWIFIYEMMDFDICLVGKIGPSEWVV